MKPKYNFTEEQKAEIAEARKKNRDKKVEKRLWALSLKAEGKTYAEIGEITEMHWKYAPKLVKAYFEKGIEAIIGNHYTGHHHNMTRQEEEEFLQKYMDEANAGRIIEVSEIEAAYREKVGHEIGSSQIYRVLRRHGWRKVMPRSKHPKKTSQEAIEASKKLSRQ